MNPPFYGKSWMHHTKRIFVVMMIVFLVGAGLMMNSRRFVAKNVYLQDQLMEGLTKDEASPLVQNLIDSLQNQQIILVVEDEEVQFQLDDLGIKFDANETVDSLFKTGWSLWLKAQALYSIEPAHKVTLVPSLSVDEMYIRSVVRSALEKREYPSEDAELAWSKGAGWTINKERVGRKLADGEVGRITKGILGNIYTVRQKSIYHPKYVGEQPDRIATDLSAMLGRAKAYEGRAINVAFGTASELIKMSEEATEWLTLNYDQKTIDVNPKKIASFAKEFTSKYDIAPAEVVVKELVEKKSEYVNENYKKAVLEGEFRSGRKIDENQLVVDLTHAFYQAESEQNVPVKFQTIPVKVRSEVEGYNFPELLSVGDSNYTLGNSENRVKNIKVALEIQDTTVVDPGETYSFNKVMGWVTYDKGFVDGWVIFGTGLGYVAGGGVCQTSTTMYRAAVNLGLPIAKRRNHSWDVAYYQDWYGIDASVYPPSGLDLAFVNDTPGPILIHSYTDDENEMAYFEMYGTSDGRKVEVVEKENVRVGAGRRVVNEWTITRPDGSVEKREIVSRYNR